MKYNESESWFAMVMDTRHQLTLPGLWYVSLWRCVVHFNLPHALNNDRVESDL